MFTVAICNSFLYPNNHIGGHVHGDGGGGLALGEGGLCGADGHGQGLAVPGGGDDVALVGHLGAHGLKHGAEGQEGALVLHLGHGVGKGQVLAVQLNGDGLLGGGGGADGELLPLGRQGGKRDMTKTLLHRILFLKHNPKKLTT